MKILFISNHEVTLYYFRCELITRLISEGNEVYISQPYGKYKDYFEALGCMCIDTHITQYGMNPLKEISLVSEYKRIICDITPDVIVTYTIKPNLYGGIAAASCKVPYISTVTGMGKAFEKGLLMKKLMVVMYRYATRKISAMFFQNEGNSKFFENNRIAKGKHRIVSGSGVNLEKHSFCEYPEDNGETKFLFIGRVMNDKGIRELLLAFERIKNSNKSISLDIVGWCEDECKELLHKAIEKGVVNYHGWKEDVRPFVKGCHAVILPSYHEGMANVLLEAQAAGRPVLASRIPGCIETFEEGVTGWGFDSQNTDSLKKAVEIFSTLPYELKKESGKKGRARMESLFDRNKVVEAYIKEIYRIGGEKK